jgi:CSLREA domain-containing protein
LIRRILILVLLAVGLTGLTAVPASAATFAVNSTDDDTDAGGCEVSPGDCTLREAIVAANVDSTADLIDFDITPNTIAIGSPLPALTQPFTIDGTTDPNSTRVTLDGPTGTNANGLTVTISSATSSTIKGMVITGFEGTGDDAGLGHGVYANTGVNTTLTLGGTGANEGNVLSGNQAQGANLRFGGLFVLQGNIIGLAEDGTTVLGNGLGGVSVQGTNSVVGGTTGVTPGGSCTGACNLISGNVQTGLRISTATQVKGNYIGTDVTGLLDRGNAGSGIGSGTSSAVEVVGGPTPQERNVISGNGGTGIGFSDSGQSNNVIQGNYIGVGADGTTPLGNSSGGIFLGADNNTIGGTTAGAGNIIAFNMTEGVRIGGNSNDNRIRGNSIHSNSALGIDHDPIGVNANDPGDSDTGANQRQNYPVTSEAEVTAGVVTVEGSLNSTPSTTFDIDVYVNTACNGVGPGDHGEGRTYLGSTTAVTDGSGIAPLAFVSSGTPVVSAGDVIAATATDPNGNTSEFSKCKTATPPQPDLSIDDVTVTEGNSGTVTAGFTVTRSGDLTGTASVGFTTTSGTATAPSDYVATSGTLNFSSMDATEPVNVTVNSDVLDEPNEMFAVNLSNATGADIIDGSGQGTITDDDPTPSISIDDVAVTEGNTGTVTATFAVTLSSQSGGIVSVDYATVNGTATAPTDYVSESDTLSIPATETSGQIDVTVNGDLLDEPNETFVVNLSDPSGATLADPQGQGTIADDDAPTPPPKCPGFEGDPRPQLVGTEGSDTLTGTGAGEVFCGLGGNDVLKGGGGNDLMLGGGGNDKLSGQGGKDILKGQAGHDKMNGGPGVDRCQGGPGKDSAKACEKGKA